MVFFGYPLLIVGSLDANRKFHLVAASLSVSENTTDFEFMFDGKKENGMQFIEYQFIIFDFLII